MTALVPVVLRCDGDETRLVLPARPAAGDYLADLPRPGRWRVTACTWRQAGEDVELVAEVGESVELVSGLEGLREAVERADDGGGGGEQGSLDLGDAQSARARGGRRRRR